MGHVEGHNVYIRQVGLEIGAFRICDRDLVKSQELHIKCKNLNFTFSICFAFAAK